MDAVELIVNAAIAHQTLEVHLCNTYTISLTASDPDLRCALQRENALNLPDGVPVALLGRSAGQRSVVRGPTLVREVVAAGADRGLRHFLFGGGPGIAETMAERLQELVPTCKIVGVEAPPFTPMSRHDIEELGSRVRLTMADIVWIGLGTPKQDKLVADLAVYFSGPIVPVGAAFDFISGHIPEAPDVLRGSGLEWIFRLLREPRRLWRRYLFGGLIFLRLVVLNWIPRKATGA